MKKDELETEPTVDEREPYEPPRLECEELFEMLALACGKINPVMFNCRTANKVS